MSLLSGYPNVAPTAVKVATTDTGMNFGTKIADTLGNEFRFVKFASAVAKGTVVSASLPIAAHSALVIATASVVGDKVISITNGATAITADQYKGGTVTVQTGTGFAQIYTISGNTAAIAAGTFSVFIDEPIAIAIPALSTLSLKANRYSAVITATTSPIEVLGVTQIAFAAGEEGLIQVTGDAAVIAAANVTAGVAIAASNSTAGGVEAAAAITEQVIGYAGAAITAGQSGAVTLTIG